MRNLLLESGVASCNKYGEDLCGDFISTIEKDDMTTIVLSDGLGSGVKANILSTLTGKILSTLSSHGVLWRKAWIPLRKRCRFALFVIWRMLRSRYCRSRLQPWHI